MDVKDALAAEVAAFKERVASSELIKLKSKFGGMDLYRPLTLSTFRQHRVSKALGDGGTAYHVDLLINIARMENGKPAFKESHRDVLMKEVDSVVLRDIAAELLDTALHRDADPNE